MRSNITRKLEQWNDLRSAKLEVLIPRAFTISHISMLQRRKLKLTPAANNPGFFLQTLPWKVAHFRPEICREVFAWARMDPDQRADKTSSFNYLKDAFRNDMEKLHLALFEQGPESFTKSTALIGPFYKAPAPKVHIDYDKCRKFGVMYISRMGQDEAEIVDGSRFACATKAERRLIEDANGIDVNTALRAKRKLQQMGILRRAPLGDVMLLANNHNGTRHCSATLRKTPSYSAYFRYAP